MTGETGDSTDTGCDTLTFTMGHALQNTGAGWPLEQDVSVRTPVDHGLAQPRSMTSHAGMINHSRPFRKKKQKPATPRRFPHRPNRVRPPMGWVRSDVGAGGVAAECSGIAFTVNSWIIVRGRRAPRMKNTSFRSVEERGQEV